MINADYLRACFRYASDTGKLYWRPRPKEHFPTTKGYSIFNARFAGKEAGAITEKGYVRVYLDGRHERAHRIIWAMYSGLWPDNEIDHINGNKSDNRISNLRVTDIQGNARNRKLRDDNKSGFSGVAWRKDLNKWSAKIGVGGGAARSLGFYETKDEAIAARRGAEIVLEYHENHGRRAS